jgi:sugar fermentation stimulation protein A
MRFSSPLRRGRLLVRYKRFLADVELDTGERLTAHCPNPGSMAGLAEPGSAVLLSESDNPQRKLRHTWELVRCGDTWVGIHTGRSNGIIGEAIHAGRIRPLRGYATLRREVAYGRNSRIDLLLEHPHKPPCYVEVKSVTLADGRLAMFPDAVTERGAKHLDELCTMVDQGARAVLCFLVQREDCTRMAPASAIDPRYAASLRRAASHGVEVHCYRARVRPRHIEVERKLPVLL